MSEFELSAAWDFGCSKAVKRQSPQMARTSLSPISKVDKLHVAHHQEFKAKWLMISGSDSELHRNANYGGQVR